MGQGKGDRIERELVNLLDRSAFTVLCAPVSEGTPDRLSEEQRLQSGELQTENALATPV